MSERPLDFIIASSTFVDNAEVMQRAGDVGMRVTLCALVDVARSFVQSFGFYVAAK